jgi:hypothetical protein
MTGNARAASRIPLPVPAKSSIGWMQWSGGGIMGKGRVEAFSDGLIANIITIMVKEFKTPEDS